MKYFREDVPQSKIIQYLDGIVIAYITIENPNKISIFRAICLMDAKLDGRREVGMLCEDVADEKLRAEYKLFADTGIIPRRFLPLYRQTMEKRRKAMNCQ